MNTRTSLGQVAKAWREGKLSLKEATDIIVDILGKKRMPKPTLKENEDLYESVRQAQQVIDVCRLLRRRDKAKARAKAKREKRKAIKLSQRMRHLRKGMSFLYGDTEERLVSLIQDSISEYAAAKVQWQEMLEEVKAKYEPEVPYYYGIDLAFRNKQYQEVVMGLPKVTVPVPFTERTGWKDEWKQDAYLKLTDAKVIEVDVYDNKGKVVDKRVLCGPIVHAVNPVIYRISVKIDKDLSVTSIYDTMCRKIRTVKQQFPNLNPLPSHDGWMKREENHLTLDIIMAENGYNGTDLRESFSRSTLWYHLQAGKSKSLGIFKCAIVYGGSLAKHDGAQYILHGNNNTPWKIWKGIAYSNYENLLASQEVLSKGMFKELRLSESMRIREEYNLGDDIQIVIPAISPKFYNDETVVDMEVFTLFPARMRERVAISLQAAGRVPLTKRGTMLMKGTWKEQICTIMDAYKDNSLDTVIGLFHKLYQEYIEVLDEELEGDLEAITLELKEKAEEMGSSMVEMLYLPLRAEEFVNKTLGTLLEKMLKKIYIPGITATAMPANIGEREVILPVAAKRMGTKIGDRVTITRSPNTGLEWVEMTVIGFTNDDVIYLNSDMFAARHSGDFDGDIVGAILIEDLVNENRIGDKASSKSKGKKPQDVVKATAKSYYAKYAIPEADKCLTLMIEAGQDSTPARELLQSIVDSIKHDIQLESIDTFKEVHKIDGELLPIYRLLKGSLGAERGRVFRYNELVQITKTQRSNVDWIRNIEKEFAYIMCANKFLDTEKPSDNNYKPYGNYKNYKKMVTFFGRPEWAVAAPVRSAIYSTDSINKIKASVMKLHTLRGKNAEVVSLAERIHESYYAKLAGNKGFCQYRLEGDIDAAYTCIRGMVEELKANPEVAGDALKYLWTCITYRLPVGRIVKPLQGYKVFSYMPTSIGTYDIEKISKAYGGRPEVDIMVVGRKETARFAVKQSPSATK